VFFRFIQPCHPPHAKTVPAGDVWQHATSARIIARPTASNRSTSLSNRL